METPYLSDRCRSRPFLDSLDLAIINLKTLGGHNETQEYHLRGEEITFLHIATELLLRKDLQNLLQVLGMLFFGLAIDQNIIKVDNNTNANEGL